MKENKKVVKTMKKIAIEGKKDFAVLKATSKDIIRGMKKRWDASEPRRKEIEANAKKSINKFIGKKGRNIVSKSVQLKKDIVKGVKQGLKNNK